MKRFFLMGAALVGLAGAPLTLEASQWFVDKDATGLNNGTSWANAWNSFGGINWSTINPGDSVFISGGPAASSKTYGSSLVVGKSGTASARILIGVKADDPSHNGTVVIQGNYIELSNRQYVTVTGNVGGAQRLALREFFNTQTATYANAIMAPSSVGIKLDSISWSNVNNAVNFSSSTGFWITNCLAQQIRGDAVVRAGSAYGSGYDANVIENSDFEVVVNSIDGGGPDGIQTGNNITARNNTFRVRKITGYYTSNQHPDMFQAPGVYLAIYNNDFINVGDSSVALGAWWSGSVHQHIRIFNNIFRIVEAIDPYPEFIRIYNNVGPIADISDVVIANNLFLDNPTWNNITFAYYGPTGGNPTGSGNYLANNIWYNSASGAAWRLDWSTNWKPDAWRIDGNVYFPATSSYVRFCGVTYPATSWVADHEPTGSVSQPVFVSYTKNSLQNNLRLAQSGTLGIDLAGVSGLRMDSDRDGVVRPPWFAGPYVYTGSVSPNYPPLVSAGSPSTIVLPTNTIGLLGSVRDPEGAPVTVAWSQVGGGAAVAFSSVNSLAPTAIFSASGIYTLRLTASDGVQSASSDVTVTVQAEANPVPPQPPRNLRVVQN